MNRKQELVGAYGRAVDALNQQDWRQAWQLASDLVRQVPGHGGVHFVAGVAALQLRDMRYALGHLRESVRLSPARADYGAQYARALAQARLLREAVEAADAAAALEISDPLTLDTLGVVFTQGNAHARACALFRRAVARMPERAGYRFNLATSLTFMGDIQAAAQEYEACLARDPRYWKAHLALAQLRKVTQADAHLPRLVRLLQVEESADARMYLNLAMAKELEDLGRHADAWPHLVKGKRAGAEGRAYSSARDAEVFDALMRAFAGAGQVQSPGFDSREPIFVIGMPRSGTTLVERMLSRHPEVHSAGELENFGVMLKRASGSRTPQLLDADTIGHAMACDWQRLGEAYVASTRPGTGHTPRFVDKLPHNFLYAGFIARALPQARIVCLRRSPMDSVLGNFRQLFAQSSPYYDYSFDILDAGRYWLLFDRLMAHWQRVLPGRILEVGYEDIVDDQQAQLRRILDHCGLRWDEACMDFQENAEPVATASAVQVREGLNRRSIGRWRRYANELQPLRELFESAGVGID